MNDLPLPTKYFFDNHKMKVRFLQQHTDYLDRNAGVPQGCVLAPTLHHTLQREGRGGVAALLIKDWSFEEMDIPGCEEFRDYITGTMTMGGPKIVAVIYNPPLYDRPKQDYDKHSCTYYNKGNNCKYLTITLLPVRNRSRYLIMGTPTMERYKNRMVAHSELNYWTWQQQTF